MRTISYQVSGKICFSVTQHMSFGLKRNGGRGRGVGVGRGRGGESRPNIQKLYSDLLQTKRQKSFDSSGFSAEGT